jgi:Tfp pilus assembly protein PilF
MRTEGNQAFSVALWVGLSAVLLRCLYYLEHARSAFFGFTVLDERFYDLTARQLAATGLNGPFSGFRSLYYPLVLSWVYSLTGTWGKIAAIGLQHALGALTAVLVGLIAHRLFSSKATGISAGVLYLLSSPPLFFEGELLITTSFTFLVALQLWLLSLAVARSDQGRSIWYLLAGICGGLATQFRAFNILFLLVYLAAAFLLWRLKERSHWRAVVTAAVSFVAVLLVSAFIMQKPVGRFQILPSAGPINFYLGNRIGADGMIPRQKEATSYGAEYRDTVELFAEQGFLEYQATSGPGAEPTLSHSAQAKYWVDQTLQEIARRPQSWGRLMVRKSWFLLWNKEIPNNKSFDFVKTHESRILRSLPIRWWLLLALAPLGCAAAWHGRGHKTLLWILGFMACYSAGLLIFFVNSRYRLPLWPALAVLAGGGTTALASSIQQRQLTKLLRNLGFISIITLLSVVNWFDVELPNYARDYFFRSTAHLSKGDLRAAELDAVASCELEPTDGAARLQLGNVHLAQGKDREALASFALASQLAPHEPVTFNNLGVTQEKLGDHYNAYRNYQQAIKLNPGYSPALVNAALLEIRAGLLIESEKTIARIVPAYTSPHLDIARGLLARDRGELDQSARLLARAQAVNPATVARILEEMRHPIDLRLAQNEPQDR